MPGLGGSVRCQGRTGFPGALKLIMSGDMINAEDALELHLVDFITARQKVFDFTLSFLQKLTRDRPLSVINAVMKALKNARSLSIQEAMKEETRMFCELALSEARRRNGS